MTKEQGKATKILERLNFLIIDLKSNKKVNEIITEEGKFNLAEDIEIVLNMLKEKDKEIEFQKDINKIEKDRHKKTEKSLKGQIIKNNKIIEKLEKEAQRYFETTIIQAEKFDKEIKKKDKIIHEMISSFIDLGFGFEYCNNDDRCINDCDKCIEQYFEKKATNDG